MMTKKNADNMIPGKKKEVMEIDLTIPTTTLLKIRFHHTDRSVFGTVLVDQNGLIVLEPNQKKQPEKMVSWSTLARIMSMGFIK